MQGTETKFRICFQVLLLLLRFMYISIFFIDKQLFFSLSSNFSLLDIF
jgi:hypothetical protein